MAQSLLLKDANPLPQVAILPDTFDFALTRDQQCVNIEEFNQFKQDYPLWGTPYGLPKIDDDKQATLLSCLENGAPYQPKQLLTSELEGEVAEWDAFFINQDSLKGPLVSRYMYEHLFQATGSAQLSMQFMHQMRPHPKQLAPDAPEEFWENFMTQLNPQEMENLIIPVYQKHLTEEDVQAITAFYSTLAGIKLVQSQPLVMQESMLIGQQWREARHSAQSPADVSGFIIQPTTRSET
jgi:hypothetical protein